MLDEHGSLVMRVIRALLGPADAEDAWSETFLAALQAYPRLRPDSDVGAWLVTIAHRKALDQLRHRARAPMPAAGVVEPPTVDGVAVDRDPDLWGAMEALSFKQRAAIAYHYIAGMPYAEVGPLIDSSETAARRSAADGLANLRRSFPRGAAS